MNKYLKTIFLIILLLIPVSTFAVTSVGWNTNSTGTGWISPNLINGVKQTAGLLNGFFSNASSTIGSTLHLPSLAQGLLFNGSSSVGSVATTSVTCSSGTSCTSFTVLGSAPITITGTGGGTNYLTASTSPLYTYLNTGTFLQAPAFFATSTTATTTITNLNNIFYVPGDFATNGCAGDATVKTFDTCVEALQAVAVAKGLSGATFMVTNNVTQAQWTSTLDFATNGFTPSLVCAAGVTLKYGGSGNAMLLNPGASVGQLQGEFANCTYMGQNTLIVAGQTNSTTTVGIYIGGAQGANGFNFRNNKWNGFGTQAEIGQHAYMLTFTDNGFSGGNGSTTSNRGSLIHINAANDSGERNVFYHNRFTDPGNSTATSSIYITSGGTASNFFSGNSFDDVGVYLGASNGQTVFDSNHWENSDYTHYGKYNLIFNPSSDLSSHISFTNNEIANDANSSATTFQTLIMHGAQLYAAGNMINNYGGQTITYFADHTNDNGLESEYICNTTVQGGALTNLMINRTWSQAVGVGCWQGLDNTWPIGMFQQVGSIGAITNGNQNVATFDQNGNWTFGGANGSVTANKNLAVTTSATVGTTLGVTGLATFTAGMIVNASTTFANPNATTTFASNVLVSTTNDSSFGFNSWNAFNIVDNQAAGPLQMNIVNRNTGVSGGSGMFLGNSKSTNQGFSSTYYAGLFMAGSGFGLYPGVLPDDMTVVTSDSNLRFAALSSNTASSTMTWSVGPGFTSANYDMTLMPTSNGIGFFGMSSSTPWAQFSINPNGIGNSPAFTIGSTTKTVFKVKQNGGVAIGKDTDISAFNTNVLDIIQANGNDESVNIQNFSSAKAVYVALNANSNFASVSIIGTGASWNFGEFGSTAFQVNDATNTKTPFSIDINSPTNALVIKSSGNIGVATGTPWRKFSVTGTVGFDGLTATGVGDQNVCITANKELSFGATCAASTQKVKDKIEPFVLGLTDVLKLNTISFTYKKGYYNQKDDIGFLAEEVNKIDPRFANHADKAENLPDGQVIKKGDPISLNISALLSATVNAVQDLYKRIVAVEKSVADLVKWNNDQDKSLKSLEEKNIAQQKQIDDLTARLNTIEGI